MNDETLPAMPRQPTADENIGIAWWNNMNRSERNAALAAAEIKLGHPASPADAWARWKNSGRSTAIVASPRSCHIGEARPELFTKSPPDRQQPSRVKAAAGHGAFMNNSYLPLPLMPLRFRLLTIPQIL